MVQENVSAAAGEADQDVMEALQHIVNMGWHPRPMAMSMFNTETFGQVMGNMANRSNRLRSLFIAAFGYRNAVPCGHCETRSLRYRVRGVGPSHADDCRAGYPFLYCISIPGFKDGLCANCAFFMASDCSWTMPATTADPVMSRLRAERRLSTFGTSFQVAIPGFCDIGDVRLPPRPDVESIPWLIMLIRLIMFGVLSPISTQPQSPGTSGRLSLPTYTSWEILLHGKRTNGGVP